MHRRPPLLMMSLHGICHVMLVMSERILERSCNMTSNACGVQVASAGQGAAPIDPAAARKAEDEAEERRLAEIRSHGTMVTPQTFAEWKRRFDAEMALQKARLQGTRAAPQPYTCVCLSLCLPRSLDLAAHIPIARMVLTRIMMCTLLLSILAGTFVHAPHV